MIFCVPTHSKLPFILVSCELPMLLGVSTNPLVGILVAEVAPKKGSTAHQYRVPNTQLRFIAAGTQTLRSSRLALRLCGPLVVVLSGLVPA